MNFDAILEHLFLLYKDTDDSANKEHFHFYNHFILDEQMLKLSLSEVYQKGKN